MSGLSKEAQIGKTVRQSKGSFGKKPSKGTFGKKPNKGGFGKKPSSGIFGKKGSSLKSSSFKRSTALKKNLISQTVSKSDLLSLAQNMFNRYVRERDRRDGCISCEESGDVVEYHAGHFLSRGAYPEYRFHEWNCNKQCAYCNTVLQGNRLGYEIGLAKKIGEENFKSLIDGKAEKFKSSVTELTKIICVYRERYEKMAKVDFTEEEIFSAIREVIDNISSMGIDEVVKGGEIVTHRVDTNATMKGYEAIVSLNPEIRVDTKDREVFGFSGSELLSMGY